MVSLLNELKILIVKTIVYGFFISPLIVMLIATLLDVLKRKPKYIKPQTISSAPIIIEKAIPAIVARSSPSVVLVENDSLQEKKQFKIEGENVIMLNPEITKNNEPKRKKSKAS